MMRRRMAVLAGFLIACGLGAAAVARAQAPNACVQWTPVIRDDGGVLREPAVAGVGLDVSRGGADARETPPAVIRVEFLFTKGTTGPAISSLLQALLQDAIRREFGGPVGIEVWESKDGTSFFAKGDRIVRAASKSGGPGLAWEISAFRNGVPLPCAQEAPAQTEDEAGPPSPLRLEIRKRLVAAKPPGLRWTDLNEKALDVMVDLVWTDVRAKAEPAGMGKDDVRRIAREVWREGRVDEQSLPSDDPKKRWEELTGKKFENLRRIDLKDEWGNLDSPMVDVFADEGKTMPIGQMNHDEWVTILESKGAMTKVQRRRDKKEAWIETKWLKEIYAKEDIAKGPGEKKNK